MTMHADAIRRRNRTLSHARGGRPIAAPRTGQTPRLTASLNAAGDVPHSLPQFLGAVYQCRRPSGGTALRHAGCYAALVTHSAPDSAADSAADRASNISSNSAPDRSEEHTSEIT